MEDKKEIQKIESPNQKIELTDNELILQGNLKNLSPADRERYILALHKLHGMNPLSRCFMLIPDQKGNLTPYATKSAAAEVRTTKEISVKMVYFGPLVALDAQYQVIKDNDGKPIWMNPDVLMTVTEVKLPDGRLDYDVGTRPANTQSPGAAADSAMVSATKSKRRATLSIAGIGFADPKEEEDEGVNVRTVTYHQLPTSTQVTTLIDGSKINARTGELLEEPVQAVEVIPSSGFGTTAQPPKPVGNGKKFPPAAGPVKVG